MSEGANEMAKARSKEPDSETPFRRFERIARKLVAVPKREIDKEQQKWERSRAKKRK